MAGLALTVAVLAVFVLPALLEGSSPLAVAVVGASTIMIITRALGVLDDVTVSQAATVAEIVRADPNASRRSLLTAGLRVGRDHVAATVNTLVLAYAGASLPLPLLFTGADGGLVDIATTELVAQEVVRALVGGVGIVAAVPITTAVAVLAFQGRGARGRGRRAQRSASPRQSD